MLQGVNMYAGSGHSSTKYNTKYHFLDLGSLRDTLCRFAIVNHCLTTQLSIVIIGLLTKYSACNVQEYVKDGRPKSTCQSQNALCSTHSDIQWMPKTVAQSMRIVSTVRISQELKQKNHQGAAAKRVVMYTSGCMFSE